MIKKSYQWNHQWRSSARKRLKVIMFILKCTVRKYRHGSVNADCWQIKIKKHLTMYSNRRLDFREGPVWHTAVSLQPLRAVDLFPMVRGLSIFTNKSFGITVYLRLDHRLWFKVTDCPPGPMRKTELENCFY